MRGVKSWLEEKDRVLYIMVAVLAAITFCCIYGIRILNPTYTDWLLVGGDLSQHYLGWLAYRLSSWHFPIGLTDMLAYPNSTSVIFTDSIPLFAVFFKILSPVLPETFQYFGLWGITCFVLQGLFSARIIKRYTKNYIAIILGALLVLVTPAVFWRLYGHEALAGQWIIVYTLDMIFSYDKYDKNPRKLYLTVASVGVLAVSIHIYFALMCGIIVFSYCIEDIIYKKRIRRSLYVLFDYCLIALLTIGLLGGFVTTGSTYNTGGLGYYSMNLNSLFNPMGVSAIIKDLPIYVAGQSEGFGYLGAGIFVLLIITMVCIIINHDTFLMKIRKNKGLVFGILSICVLIIIVASQTTASIGQLKVYELTLPELITKLWSVFRACGRIVMVIDYVVPFVCIAVVAYLCKNRPNIIAIFLGIVLSLQVYDIHGMLLGKNRQYSEKVTYESPLYPDSVWNAIVDCNQIRHVVIASWIGDYNYYSLGEWALSNKLTMSSFAMVHANHNTVKKAAQQYLENPTPDEVFVFEKSDIGRILASDFSLNYYDAGNYIVGYLGDLPGCNILDVTQYAVVDSSEYIYIYSDNNYLINGEDVGGIRHVYCGGTSYGPYWDIPAGKWKITINGENLDNGATINITGDGGERQYGYTVLRLDEKGMEIEFETLEMINDFEVVIINNSDNEMLLTKLSIELE